MTTYLSKLSRRGSTRAWRAIRAAAIKLARGRCQICGLREPSLEAHHRVSRELGGDDSIGKRGNILVCCSRCHGALEQG